MFRDGQTKKNVLIVDDEKALLQILTLVLRKEGYNVDIAETGREALDKIERQLYDIALVDMRLRDMEGSELLKAFNAKRADFKKIILSGLITPEDRKKLNGCADACLEKPFKVEELLKVIREKLER
jgi:DNA-binding response OmpR family regulator